MINKFFSFIFYLVFPALVFGQEAKTGKTDTIYISLTNYSCAYNSMFTGGSTAFGTSLFLKDRRVAIQLALLYDIKQYIYTEHLTHLQDETYKGINLFFSGLIHYDLIRNEKFNYFFTSGINLGGVYYIDDKNLTKKTNVLNFVLGTGISVKVNNFSLRFLPSIRFNKNNIFPSIFLDILIPIKIWINKN